MAEVAGHSAAGCGYPAPGLNLEVVEDQDKPEVLEVSRLQGWEGKLVGIPVGDA